MGWIRYPSTNQVFRCAHRINCFMDIEIPEGDSMLIDLNKAYNPYCAYSTRYACPITPDDNFLDIEVKAGVRME